MEGSMRKKAERGQRPEHAFRTLKRLYKYLAEMKSVFYGLLVILVLILACELAMPLIIESCINAINFADGVRVDFKGLTMDLILFGLVVLANAALGYLQGKLAAKLTLNMTAGLRRDLFKKIMSLQVSAMDARKKGDLMSRILNDTDMAARTFAETVMAVFSSFILIGGCAVIMLIKSPVLAAISIGTAVVSTVVAALLSKLVFPAFSAQQAALGNLNSHVEESLKGFRTGLSMGRTDENNRKMDQLSGDFYKKRMKAYALENIIGPFMLVCGNLNFLLVVIFGAKFALSGLITLGTMQAFILYSKQFMEPVNSLGENLVSVQNSLVGAERIFFIMDLPEEEKRQSSAEDITAAAKIVFDNISFGYHKNMPVLNSLALTVQPGERLALVGRTGVGKTTLVNLLMQFYTAYDGNIFINGKNVNEYSLDQLRSAVIYIAQEPQIIDGTIAENISYGIENADREQIRKAAERVEILEMIDSLPDGFDTKVRSGSEKFSQGQLQLFVLARAAMRDAGIIILDEATSSVDMTTEAMVKRGMEALFKDKTCIIIAHRMASIRDADHIAVLADGKISEYGSHDELMELSGNYFTIYNNQFLGEEV